MDLYFNYFSVKKIFKLIYKSRCLVVFFCFVSFWFARRRTMGNATVILCDKTQGGWWEASSGFPGIFLWAWSTRERAHETEREREAKWRSHSKTNKKNKKNKFRMKVLKKRAKLWNGRWSAAEIPFFYCCGESCGRRIFLTQDGLTNQGEKNSEDEIWGRVGGENSQRECSRYSV